MIIFRANVRRATSCTDDAITTSSAGIPVLLQLAPEFAGLAKTVIFAAGRAKVDVALMGDEAELVLPPDVLTAKDTRLHIGIYAADSGGEIVIPTVWASPGIIQEGALPSGVDPSAPTPSWVAQVQEAASEALELATAVKEAADAGAFDGEDGFSPTVTVEDIQGGHRVIITDVDGPHAFDVMDGQDGAPGADGAPGQDGQDGVSPEVTIASITGGHSVTITDADHPGGQTFNVIDGKNGAGGISPAVTITDITGGHRVVITDEDHPLGQTFDVMDGEDGADGAPGQDGQDGVSPEVTISSITGGHSVTITDADHPGGQTFNVMDGENGADGVSPTVTITAIAGGHRVVITDADHPLGQTFDVMDGQDGADGADGTDGTDGADGTTFTPAVSSAGVISWTNDGGKTNPQSVDLVAAVISALPTWTGGSF